MILTLDTEKKTGGKRCRIAFPDFEDDRVREAIRQLGSDARVEPTQVRPPFPPTDIDTFAQALCARNEARGMTIKEAKTLLADPFYFAAMALAAGRFDGVVAGASRSTAETVRCALRCLGPRSGTHVVFGLFLMEPPPPSDPSKEKRLLFADCAVIPEPSGRTLAHIGVEAARAFEFFTNDAPRVAFLSFSTHGSADHELTRKVSEAVALARKLSPELPLDGEFQVDAALERRVAERKGVGQSPVAGRANVLIFPDLNSGNIGYKLTERLGGYRAIGPILWGLSKPMSDLSRGCSVPDVCDAARALALMAQGVTQPC